jgi:Ca2+-binding RTX toxin-like protein
VADIAVGANGGLFVVGDTAVRLYSNATGAPVNLSFATGFTLIPTGITVSTDGNLFVGNPFTQSVRVFNPVGQTVLDIPIPGVSDIAVSPDGNSLYAIAGNTVQVRGSINGTLISGLNAFPLSLAFAPNGNLFITNTGNNTVQEFNGQTGALVRTFNIQGTPGYIVIVDLAAIGVPVSPPPGGGTPGSNPITGNNRNNRLVGTSQADTLLGLGGNDTLVGRNGNDRLEGGAGNDFLDGGRGRDTYVGGGGRDRFKLARREGRDTILDFQNGSDRLALAGNLEFDDLTIRRSGRNTLISAGREQLAVLLNINPNQITAADFVTL